MKRYGIMLVLAIAIAIVGCGKSAGVPRYQVSAENLDGQTDLSVVTKVELVYLPDGRGARVLIHYKQKSAEAKKLGSGLTLNISTDEGKQIADKGRIVLVSDEGEREFPVTVLKPEPR